MTEFVPIELLVIYDLNDLPNRYKKIIKNYLKVKYGLKGKLTHDVWDYGKEIRIIHWEWFHEQKYKLIVDITFYPNDEEAGIVWMDKNVFENCNLILTPLVTKHPLLGYIKEFEEVRRLDSEALDELKKDLNEESVDEEEIASLLTDHVHMSSDDASDID